MSLLLLALLLGTAPSPATPRAPATPPAISLPATALPATPRVATPRVATRPAGIAAAPQQVPTSDGWITDLAGLLSAGEERELEALMESYRQGSGHEIALLTVPSLEGGAIEPFALRVAREWGLGREGENDGALLVVSKADRKVRIEVGRGLEGTLPDSVCGRIIRNVITPEFRKGRFGAGLERGLRALHAAAGGDYGAIPARRGPQAAPAGFAVFGLVMLFVVLALLRGRRAVRRRGRGMDGALPWILWSAMGSSGRHGGGGFGGSGGGFGGGGFGGFGGGGGFSGGGASGGW